METVCSKLDGLHLRTGQKSPALDMAIAATDSAAVEPVAQAGV